MSTVLAERGGVMYAKETTTDYFEPRRIVSWWPLGIRWYQFKQWFGDEERARAAMGGSLHPTSNTSYQDERGWTYRLTDGGQTKPAFTDLEPIAEPVQRGKKKPVRWQHGKWEKYTAKGWVPA